MKKMFLMAAMAGVALASCTKNDVETPEQDIITFAEPVTAVQTKATEIVGNYPTSENFSVFAHYYTEVENGYTTFANGELYMNNVETKFSEALNGWDSKAVTGGVNYYWPKQGTLTFAAYSPSRADNVDMQVAYTENGIQFNNFKVKENAAEQYDLLFSERTYDQTKSSMTTAADPYKGVQIKFNHALSSIVFKVKTNIDYTADNFYITLRKIELRNITEQGSFNQGLADVKNAVTPNENKGWTIAANAPATNYVAYEGSQSVDTELKLTNNIQNLYNTNLILLPQPLTATKKLYIEYTITNGNVSPWLEVAQTAEIALTNYGQVTEWLRGNRYTYNITIGLDKIYFDPTVDAWDDVNAGNVTIGNTAQPAN